tara:strand:- start:110 stop:532 length:423 start_codon:yes stop_codon:yes gene_type:complete
MISWTCKRTWYNASVNTCWCLFGCSIGDFGTIYFFQSIDHTFSVMSIMIIAMINGIISSIILETYKLSKSLDIKDAFYTAIGMSLISMLSMELAMNTVDYFLTGGAIINFYSILPMFIAGYITPLPYNYWKLKKYNEACH